MLIVSFSPYMPSARVTHAGGLCLYHHTAALAREHDVVLVAPDDDPGNRVGVGNGPPGVRVHLVTVPPRRDSTAGRIQRRLLWLKDAPGASRRVQRAFADDAELWKIVEQADLVELHFNYSLAFVDLVRRRAPRIPVVAVIYEAFSASLVSRLRHASPVRRAESAILLARARHRERQSLNQVSAVRVLADRDREALRKLGVSPPIHVIAPWVDPVPAVEVSPDETVLFVGALWRWENAHGVEWLLREVWPTVRRQRPAAHLVLVGAGPPAALQSTRVAGVTVTGFVPDLAPYYASARCVVAPVQMGGGIQVKVPQAMFHGLPVVATTFSAHGLGDNGARDALAGVHDTAEGFAATVVELLADRRRAQEAGARARAVALRRWSADAYSERLLSAYAEFTPHG